MIYSFDFEWNILTIVEWIAIKFDTIKSYNN